MTSRPRLLALALLAAVVALPGSAQAPRDWLAEADAAILRGDGIAAEVAARRALEAGSPRAVVSPYMGRAELLQGELREAHRWLDDRKFADSQWERGYHALALLWMAEGDLPGAARAFETALERGPGSPLLWVDFGRLRYRGGEQHLAREAALRALELGPKEPRALMFRAQLARDSEGLVAALAWFERALQMAPDDADLMAEYAATLGEAGRYADMLATVRRMAQVDPSRPAVPYLQAVLAARSGEENLARRLLYKTGDGYSQTPAGLLLNGAIELQGGNSSLAVEHFAELVEMQPQNTMAQLLFGRALLANGEGNEAFARLRGTADRPDASPYLLVLVARSLEEMGDREAAAAYLDRAGRAMAQRPLFPLPTDDAGDLLIFRFGGDASRADVALVRLRKLLSENRPGEARDLAYRLATQYPHSSDIELLVGDVALLAGDNAAALGNYARSASVRRNLPLVLRVVAAHRAAGNTNAAIAALENYLRQYPRDTDAALALGYVRNEAGDRRGAMRAFGYVLALGRGWHDPYMLATLAEAQLSLGQVEDAHTNASRAYGIQRWSGPVARTLARTAKRAGQPDAARSLDRKAAAAI